MAPLMTKRSLLYPRIVLGVIAASFGAILVRLAGDTPPLAIAAWRLTLAGLVFAPIAILRRQRTLSHSTLVWSIVSGAALALHFVFWISSLQYTTVASSVLFVTTHPIFVAVGSFLFLKEKPSVLIVIGIPIAIAGGALIGFGDIAIGGAAVRGDLLALGGGLMAAIYFLIGRHVRQTVSVAEYIAVTYRTGAIVVLALCAVTRTPLVGFAPSTYGFLVLLALIPQLIGHSTFNWALKVLPAAKVSVLILGEPIGSALLALAFFGESVPGLNLVGAAIILVGIYLCLRSKEGPDGDER
jgi:drug/metabolite transporter (DMT)-like permease